MKNLLTTITKTLKANKLPIASAFVAVALVSVPVAAHQSQQNRGLDKAYEQQVKKVDEPKQVAKADEKKSTKKADSSTETKTQSKTTTYQKPKTVSTKPKTYTKPKTEQKTEVKWVNVVASSDGTTVSATIDSSKSGTCNVTFKDYTDSSNPKYSTVTVNASGGKCSTSIPAGSWTHVMVQFKANDYSAKGSSAKIEL